MLFRSEVRNDERREVDSVIPSCSRRHIQQRVAKEKNLGLMKYIPDNKRKCTYMGTQTRRSPPVAAPSQRDQGGSRSSARHPFRPALRPCRCSSSGPAQVRRASSRGRCTHSCGSRCSEGRRSRSRCERNPHRSIVRSTATRPQSTPARRD